MITIFSGNDYINKKSAYSSFVSSLKEEGGVVFYICDEESSSLDSLDRYASGGGMFFDRVCVTLQDPLSNKNIKEKIYENIELLKESNTVFIFIENGELSAEEKKFFEKNKTQINEFSLEDESKYNSFVLTDALLQKDKKKFWVELQKYLSTGESAEAIHGLLWWQIKALTMLSLGVSQKDSGLKDFPYRKTKSSLKNFEKQDMISFSREFADLVVSSRRKGSPLSSEIELFFLKNL